MHYGQYVFAQITKFLPKRYFERLAVKYNDRTRGWSLTHWSHLLVLMFGQLLGCRSLRELTDITVAHARKSFFSALEKVMSTGKSFRRRTPSETIESLKSLRFTWWRLIEDTLTFPVSMKSIVWGRSLLYGKSSIPPMRLKADLISRKEEKCDNNIIYSLWFSILPIYCFNHQ